MDTCDPSAVLSAVRSGPDCAAVITVTATDSSGNTSLPVSYNTHIDTTPPAIGAITASQGMVDVKNCANDTLQGVVTITVVASDNCSLLNGHPSVNLVNGVNTASATFVSGTGTVPDPFIYTWTVGPATANGTWTATVTAADGCNSVSSTFTLCVNKSQITGQLQLESFVGTGTLPTAHTRTVTFVASSGPFGSPTVLKTWVVTLSNVTGDTFDYSLSDVPAGTTHLSAKTDWNKRRKLPATFDVNG